MNESSSLQAPSRSRPRGTRESQERRRRRSAVAALALLPLAAGAVIAMIFSLNESPASAPPRVHLLLDMDSEGASVVSNTSDFRVEFVTAGGGTIAFTPSHEGSGLAASFPAPDSGRNAVIAVSNAGSVDELAPAYSAFSFGAEFRTMVGGKVDGDNVIQRGLADDAGQFKLETDSGVAACSIKGDTGAVVVKAGDELVPGIWYAAVCSRDDSGVSLTVTRLDTRSIWSSRRDVDVGLVAAHSVDVPLTVGGKLTPDRQIAAWSPDQFNGEVDNAFLTIASGSSPAR